MDDVIIQRELRVRAGEEVPRKIIEDFVMDIRMLHTIYGSYEKLGRRIGVSLFTVRRWYKGIKLPVFDHYIRVKQVLAEDLLESKRRTDG